MLRYSYYEEDMTLVAIVSEDTTEEEIAKLKEKYDKVRYEE